MLLRQGSLTIDQHEVSSARISAPVRRRVFCRARMSDRKAGRRRNLLCASLFACGAVSAQEAVRMSLTSAAAAAIRKQSIAAPGYSQFKLGPTLWKLGAGLSLEANDNIQAAARDAQADLILRPEARMQLQWSVSDQNQLVLNLGGGYSAYQLHPEFNRLFVIPGTQITFDSYVADWWFNWHDRLSITESTYEDPMVVGVGDYTRLENVAGLSAVWDLNHAILRLGWDHMDSINLAGNFLEEPNRQSEAVSAALVYTPASSLQLGAEAGGGWLQYESSNAATFYTQASQWSLGITTEWQLSQYFALKGSGGYTVFSPSFSAIKASAFDFEGIYFQGDVTHRVNRLVHYTLSGGRSVNFTCYGGTLDLSYARLAVNWALLRRTSLATCLDYQHGTQLTLSGETFDRVGPSVSMGRALASHVHLSFSYHYYWRSSNLVNRDYQANLATISSRYDF